MTNTAQPLITIGITAYNAENTIQRAVDSALSQNWPHTDIVVVDDRSTDSTPAVLQDIVSKNPKIRVFTQKENRGVAAARNLIVQEAKGELIAFFDDDDKSAPDRLTQQYKRISNYEKRFDKEVMVICHTARTQYYPDGMQRYEPTPGTNKNAMAPNGEAMARRILFGEPLDHGFGSLPTCSQMGRKSHYLKLGGFDESFRRSEDTEFNVRFALAGGHFVGIAEPLVTQRMTKGSEKTIEAERTAGIACLEKHKAFIELHVSFEFCRQWLDAKYDYLEGHKERFFSKMLKLAFSHPMNTGRRMMWAWPNRQYNKRFKSFHRGAV